MLFCKTSLSGSRAYGALLTRAEKRGDGNSETLAETPLARKKNMVVAATHLSPGLTQ